MKDPALLEYGDRQAFKVRIFPLAPPNTRRVQLSHTEPLRSDAIDAAASRSFAVARLPQ